MLNPKTPPSLKRFRLVCGCFVRLGAGAELGLLVVVDSDSDSNAGLT